MNVKILNFQIPLCHPRPCLSHAPLPSPSLWRLVEVTLTPRQHGILRANPATPAEQPASSRYGRINMACPTPLVQHLSVLSIRTRLLRYVHITVVVLSQFHITVLALQYLCNMSRCCKKSALSLCHCETYTSPSRYCQTLTTSLQ